MDEKRVADYFVVAGLPPKLEPLEQLEEEAVLRPDHKLDPITDIAVINRSLGETVPPDFKIIDLTPSGFPADLNHGSIRAPEIYLCYQRGRDKPPLADIGVLYDGKDVKEMVMDDSEAILTTPYGRSANVNNSNSNRTHLTYRRVSETAACDELAVVDICVILTNKGEGPPHAFHQIDKTLNRGMTGSDVYICYKKSMSKAHAIAYKPGILSRYPQHDYLNFPLPESVPLFCLPLGTSIESWPEKAEHPKPLFSTFVLTGASGEKVYGAAVMFYEEYDVNKLNESQEQALGLLDAKGNRTMARTVHGTKCICLLSHWPYFGTFKKFLKYLYRLSTSGPHNVPIERHISHFMTEVPFPSPQRPRILVQLSDDVIPLSQPEETPLPQSGASFIKMLRHLGPDLCLNLLLSALLEHKILVHSLLPDVLTSVAEALLQIIFPFHWECPYIPLCPLGLSGVLNAPCPFIVGVDSRYFDTFELPPEVTCVDLDTKTITWAEERKGVGHKMLPKKATKVLRSTLTNLFDRLLKLPLDSESPEEVGLDLGAIDHDFIRRRKELAMEMQIQEAFLRFMATILKGYDNYLLPITAAPTEGTTDLSSLFDVQGFVKSRDKAFHKFFSQLVRTQLFSRFIEVRSFVSDKDACLAFFDECASKVNEDNKEEARLIDMEDTSRSERTVFIYPPEPIGLPEGVTYSYTHFPELKADLFSTQRTPVFSTPVKQICPNSPMTKRTKQEVRSAQKIAQKQSESPKAWARCLMAHCYSLWFTHLPAYIKSMHSKTKALRSAYDVLVRMQSDNLQPPDEVCYRVLMQLCGLYHQPVLAVKVLFELKRNGVQPNAITYGFYNKVVLESKWPSSDTNAYMKWTKLRNVILAVAQFRQALHGRRLSAAYSTSESDFDRISRASTDSFLDEMAIVDRPSAAKTEFVNDLVAVESPNIEERISTGGMSDRGYSSMTSEDTKRSSVIIGSQDSLDSLSKVFPGKADKHESEKANRQSIHNNHQQKDKAVRGVVQQLTFDSGDSNQADAVLRHHVNKIFCKSSTASVTTTSTDSHSTSSLGATFGSSAGLLMTSQSTLDEGLFGQLGISKSLLYNGEPVIEDAKQREKWRKRHRSAGDFGRRRPASAHQDQSSSLAAGDSAIVSPSCRQNLELRLDAAGDAPGTDDKNTDNEKSVSFETQPRHHIFSRTTQLESVDESKPPDPDWTPLMSTEKTNADVSDAMSELQSALDPLSAESSTDTPGAQPELSTDIQENTGSDVKASPSHSVRTPVTENDPLGLFSPPPSSSSSASTQPLCGQADTGAVLGKSAVDMLFGLGDSNTADPNASIVSAELNAASPDAANNAERSSMLLDLQPFSKTSTPVTEGTRIPAPPTPTHSAGSTSKSTTSLSSNETSSPGSPAETWTPLAQSPFQRATSRTSKSGKLSGRQSFRNAFNSAANLASKALTASKGASKVIGSRLTDLKQNISTPSKTQSESLTSLPRATSGDPDKPLLDQDSPNSPEDGAVADASLVDTATPSSVASSEDGSDLRRGVTKQSNTVSDLLNRWQASLPSLQGSLQGLAQSLDSLKGSISWQADEQKSVQMSDLMDGQRSSKGGMGSASGSVASIPPTLFNMAMECEMCSMSRCPSCNGLLYDEELMAGWSADDSNLNTSCQFCHTKFVPLLQIQVKDFRQTSRPCVLLPSQSCESMQSIQSMPNVQIMTAGSKPSSSAALANVGSQGSLLDAVDQASAVNGLTNQSSASIEDMLTINFTPTSEEADVTTNQTSQPALSSNQSTDLVSLDSQGSDLVTLANHDGDLVSIDSQNTDTVSLTNKSADLVDLTEQNTDSVAPLADEEQVDGLCSSTLAKNDNDLYSAGASICTSNHKLSQLDTVVPPPESTEGTLIDLTSSPVRQNNTVDMDKSVDFETPEKTKSPSRLRSVSDYTNPFATPPADVSPPKSVLSEGESSTQDDAASVSSNTEHEAEGRRKTVVVEPFTVPYLSPLVLRKEVENIMEQEGELSLSTPDFLDLHPIIFWNLVWFFKRLDVPSHLPGFVLTAKTTNNRNTMIPKAWTSADSRHVLIRTLWDNLKIQEQVGPPMYVLWKNNENQSTTVDALVTETQAFSRSIMQQMILCIMKNDLRTPVQMIMGERAKLRKLPRGWRRFRSMYRDLLFLAFASLGREEIDHDAFDREYSQVLNGYDGRGPLSNKELAQVLPFDRPPRPSVIYCRRLFSDLEL